MAKVCYSFFIKVMCFVLSVHARDVKFCREEVHDIVLVDWWMCGLIESVVRKRPSICLLKYGNKQDVIFREQVLKVNRFRVGLKIVFVVVVGGASISKSL